VTGMTLIIRPETSAEHESIRHVNRLAFAQDDEARLVDALREGGKTVGSGVITEVVE
jgi:predicted N-acetyltransferase YhbS